MHRRLRTSRGLGGARPDNRADGGDGRRRMVCLEPVPLGTPLARLRRVMRWTTVGSVGIGVAVLVAGLVASALTGYWLLLLPTWSFGLLHITLAVQAWSAGYGGQVLCRDRQLRRSFHAEGQPAALLIRASRLIVRVQFDVSGFRLVLARGWHECALCHRHRPDRLILQISARYSLKRENKITRKAITRNATMEYAKPFSPRWLECSSS